MKKFNKLIIACDGESASGKSTAAKLISKKYNLLLINSGTPMPIWLILFALESAKVFSIMKFKFLVSFLKDFEGKISFLEAQFLLVCLIMGEW
mgnify:CR=1 FL=1